MRECKICRKPITDEEYKNRLRLLCAYHNGYVGVVKGKDYNSHIDPEGRIAHKDFIRGKDNT